MTPDATLKHEIAGMLHDMARGAELAGDPMPDVGGQVKIFGGQLQAADFAAECRALAKGLDPTAW